MIDIRPVGYVVGWLVVMLGALMTLPMGIDLVDGNQNYRAFAVSIVLLISIGTSLTIACSGGWRTDLSLRQGFLLTTMSWVAFALASTLPLMLGAPDLDFTDALFEMTSALTTTGATVIAGLEYLPRGVLLWRSLLNWVGGIGIVLMALILLPVLNIGGMQLLRTGDFNTLGKIMPRAKEIALSVGAVYVVLTMICAMGYVWSGMSGFDAFVHAMGTVATGGMGNYDSSFAGFTPAAQYICAAFMMLGAMSFVRYVQFARGDRASLFGDSQIRAFLLIYALFCVGLIIARLMNDEKLSEPMVREVLFNMASVISTTGYATTDYSLWGSLSQVLFFCAMMICGCSGSTTGGPKVFRYQLLLADALAEIKRFYSPSAVNIARYQGRAVTPDVMNSVMAFFMMYFLTLGIVTVLLVLVGLSPITAISGAATAISNVGPGLGSEIGPAGNFAGLPDTAKWVLTVSMLIGRLELMAVYVLFTAAFWRN